MAHRRPATTLVAAIVICVVVGASGAVFTAQGLETWYPSLTKPWFTPPNRVFGPVWTLLFGLMGAAAWLVWQRYPERPDGARTALVLFGAQFALNVAWSAAFFGARSPLLGLAVIAALLVAVATTVAAFDRVDRWAALLLLPYLAWTAFAALLNLRIWMLN